MLSVGSAVAAQPGDRLLPAFDVGVGQAIFAGLLLLVALTVTVSALSVGHGRRRDFLREARIVLVAYFAYFLVRGFTEGDAATALRHAELIEQAERSLGLFVEPTMQAAIVGEQWLMDVANWVYLWGHWPVIGVAAIWLFAKSPSGYQRTRNAFLISGAIGLIFFSVFPTAPPRLSDIGLVDTVVERLNFYHLLQPPQLTNQYAAFPSLHFGWNLLVGIALVRYGTTRGHTFLGVLSPAAMGVAIVVTANHYILDLIAGGLVALLGLLLATLLAHREVLARRLRTSSLVGNA